MRSHNAGPDRKHAYVSEFEQFMNRYSAEHPRMEEDQLRGWYIWWDHRVDFDDLSKQQADTVPYKAYFYS